MCARSRRRSTRGCARGGALARGLATGAAHPGASAWWRPARWLDCLAPCGSVVAARAVAPTRTQESLQAVREVQLPDNGPNLRNDDRILQTAKLYRDVFAKVSGGGEHALRAVWDGDARRT